MKLKSILLSLPLLSVIGCAHLSSTTSTPIVVNVNGTNVIAYATTSAKAITVFDANSQLTKFRNSNGGPTNSYSAGTVASGVDQNSSSSNLVSILNAAAAIASKVP